MNYQVFFDCEWVFPDSTGGEQRAEVSLARGGHGGFQVLLAGAEAWKVTVEWAGEALDAELFAMLPVGVNENTAPTLMTTLDYESCKAYVTRQAPFEVFDALRPLARHSAPLRALYVRLHADTKHRAGAYVGQVMLNAGEERTAIPFTVQVHQAAVPPLSEAKLGFLNFCSYENIAEQHGTVQGTEKYWRLYRQYVDLQLSMRATHILLPLAQPLRDASGKVEDFDFSFCEQAARIALEQGARYVCGGHVAHWHKWDDKEYYLDWDGEVSATDAEGYAQLKLYFGGWAKLVAKNGWQGRVMQCLADEPQTHNDTTYRMLSAICRKLLPGVPILDAVETTQLFGGLDIWVPKQQTYEKHREAYDNVRGMGEEMWFYTCAYPAGEYMNRSMDLPLTVTREVLWRGFGYGLTGFLHWGLNYYIGADLWHSACCPHLGELLPAGDAHIVYPDGGDVLPSLRLEAQRSGAEDYELLCMLQAKRPELAQALVERVCPSFHQYERSARAFLQAREELLAALDEE